MKQAASIKTRLEKLLNQLMRTFKSIEPERKAASDLKERVDEVVKRLEQAGEIRTTARLTHGDERVNKLWSLGNFLRHRAALAAKRDETAWMVISGANLFSLPDTTEALKRMVAMREELDGLRDACDGIKVLVYTIEASNDILGGELLGFVTTAKIIDFEAVRDTVRQYDACIHFLEITRERVVTCIRVLEDTKNRLHGFIVNKNNPRRFTDALNRHSPSFKSGIPKEMQISPFRHGIK
jgi:hypothetical protein